MRAEEEYARPRTQHSRRPAQPWHPAQEIPEVLRIDDRGSGTAGKRSRRGRSDARKETAAGAGLAGVSGLRRQHGIDACAPAIRRSPNWCFHFSPGSITKPSWRRRASRPRAFWIAWCARRAGKYLAVVEGSIPTANPAYCTIGGRSAMDIAKRVCGSAAAVIAVGSCAFDGGPQRSAPESDRRHRRGRGCPAPQSGEHGRLPA